MAAGRTGTARQRARPLRRGRPAHRPQFQDCRNFGDRAGDPAGGRGRLALVQLSGLPDPSIDGGRTDGAAAASGA